ncbi:hypothetical protein LCGC14_2542300, partial [marine sediment metagenome]
MTKQDTIYRKLSELAVGSALNSGGFGRLPHNLVGGIVGVSDYGDRYPELYVEKEGRIRPFDFGASVLNSAVGHCSIVYNLRGPQFQLTAADETSIHFAEPDRSFSYAIKLAKTQIAAQRAQLMVVLIFKDEERTALAMVLYDGEIVGSARRV